VWIGLHIGEFLQFIFSHNDWLDFATAKVGIFDGVLIMILKRKTKQSEDFTPTFNRFYYFWATNR
jgi:hypothetical protein